MEKRWTIRGRKISEEDIDLINKLIKVYFDKGRKHISRQLAQEWKWYQANGNLKDMACRYILLYLEQQGIIKLPPRLHSQNNEKRKVKPISIAEIRLSGKVKDHGSIELKLLKKAEEYRLWNRIIESYHYQGYKIIVGKFLKYICYVEGHPVACLGWGSAAWSLNPRDKWIDWDKETKDKKLCGIVNNIRFLILPWVKIKNLASYLLGISVRRIAKDWQERYGDKINLLETFVEKERFEGTCYKAANWVYLGQTQGSAKRGSKHHYHGNIKKIFVYPLSKDFRQRLKQI